MSILDSVVELSERESKSLKIIMGEVGSGKTSFLKDMPDAAGGDILYIPIGNDMGFNQLKSDKRFKTLPNSVRTTYVRDKKGRKIAIKTRVLPQIIEILESFLSGGHKFEGLTIDAISTLQESIEIEIKFEKSKNMDWDDWGAIKKGMFRVYELCEEIASLGFDVALQSHFQIREYEDVYSGEKMSRTLPMMTENNAVRILKNSDAVVFIKVMSDGKDRKLVKRMSILGGHPVIPTKIRNNHNLSFDGILFQNLTYAGLIKLMQIESIEGIEGTEDLEGVTITKEADKKLRKKGRASKQKEVEETTLSEEVKTTTTVAKKKPTKKGSKPVEVVEEAEVIVPKKTPKRKPKAQVSEPTGEVKEVKPTKRKPTKRRTVVTEEVEEVEEVKETVARKKPAKKKPATATKSVIDDNTELEDDDLFDD